MVAERPTASKLQSRKCSAYKKWFTDSVSVILPAARSVDIEFKDAKLRDLCEDAKLAQKKFGKPVATKLTQRVNELVVADNLDELPPSGRLHLLKRDFADCYALDLHGGYRLVIRPTNDPLPRRPDGGLDRRRITIVQIEYIGDYHD